MATNLPTNKFAELIMEDILAVARGMGVESSNRIIDKAPVGSGKLRASIRASLNSETVEFGASDPSGSTTKTANATIISKAQPGDEINIVVGAPYGAVIEYGDASRPPVGFLLTTGEEYEAILAVAIQTKGQFK